MFPSHQPYIYHFIFLSDNPLYGIWFGEVTGLKKPYQQWVAAAAVPAICFRGLPVMKYGYLARSNTSVEKNIAVLGLEGLPADAKLKLVEGLRRRARHWAFATIFAVSFALKKRDEAVRDNIKKKEYEDICKKGKYEQ